MAILLTAACGYNPSKSVVPDAGDSTGGVTTQAGATADGGLTAAGGAPAPDAQVIAGNQASTGSDANGGAGGSSGGAGTGGITGAAGTGGAVVRPDAGPNPDTALADAPVTCPAPVAPSHGSVVPTSLNVGGQAAYTCTSGYNPPSPATRTCQADGTWSGPNPTCSPVDCGKLEAPAHGRVDASSTTFESKAKYSCSPNYSLVGADSRSCQAQATWSGTAPTCQCSGAMCDGVCVDLKTDNANCGACGKICATVSPSTAECTPTGCLVTLAQGTTISSIAVDATHVYWVDGNTGKLGTVNKVPVRGGAPVTLATNQETPNSLVVNATHVYWASWNEEAIRRVPLAGGLTTTLVSNVNGPSGLVLNSTHLYYVSNLGVNRLPLAGGDPVVFAAAPYGGIAITLALTSTDVFSRVDNLVGTFSAKVMKHSLEGNSAPTTLVSTSNIGLLAADATHVYWLSASDMGGCLAKVPVTGGEPTYLATDLGQTGQLVLDETHVYWTNPTGAQVLRLPKTGGTPTVLASGEKLPRAIALDATSVYWSSMANSSSVLQKLTPR